MKNKEYQILSIIKYSPPIFIIFLSLTLTFFFYYDNKNTFLEEKTNIEKNYLTANNNAIKEEINKVYDFIEKLQKSTEIELKNSIKERVYEAYSIINSIYTKYKNTKSKEEILEIIKTALNDLRYNSNRGYFFIVDSNAISILQPSIKEYENTNLFNYEDARGYKFMQSIVETINNKEERFDEYFWKNPNSSNISSKKISFYKTYDALNIAVGSGEYVEDFENEIQKKALEYIQLMHLGKNSYLFVIKYDGIYLNHKKTDLVGKNIKANKETADVFEELLNIAKNGEGFHTYTQAKKPNSNLPTRKISYVKGINNWSWMIGSGFYEDEINKDLYEKEKKATEKFDDYKKNIFIISLLLTLFLLFISIRVSKFLENKFNEYKIEIERKQAILYQQSKMAAMGEMIGNIAHQWRQPLSIISTASTGILVSKNLGVLEDLLLEESLKKINSSAQYLSKTIDDFRNFFNPEKVKNTFLLKDTIKTTLELVSARFNSQNIELIQNVEEIQISNYENELIQALINILNNARDEFEFKGSTLEKKLIFIDIYKESNYLFIKIKDNAGGILDENIEKIFKPYFTTKKKSEGTGIGLYMTQEIIVGHLNGQIFVQNENYIYEDIICKGAVFIIKIPLS